MLRAPHFADSFADSEAKLSPTERSELAQIARRLGVQRAAREIGVSRTSYGALVIGTAMPLVEAQAARALPRLRAELESHDTNGDDDAA